MGKQPQSLLESVKVLDLTDGGALFCGRILADMGADVVKIETSNEYARNLGPFFHNDADPEKSLFWFAYNLNKKGITLDIRTTKGQGIFKKLARSADIILESFSPGYLQTLELDYNTIIKHNPGLIMTSITPFGLTGPYRDYKGSDIVVNAMAGYLYLCGDPDRAPLQIGVPQAFLLAGANAAAQTMMALYYREITGEGQYIDISAQQSVVPTTTQALPFWILNNKILERNGSFRVGLTVDTRLRQVWPCKDGFVVFLIFGGSTGGSKWNRALTQYMAEDGIDISYLGNIDFNNLDVNKVTQEEWIKIEEPITEFFLKHSQMELFKEGLRRNIPIGPLWTPSDLSNYAQLQARAFWIEVNHDELSTNLKYPGFFAKFSKTPCKLYRRAPLIGEHNKEIYVDELGVPEEEIPKVQKGK
jgi:benzylsuccinate CoA-transferase BbsE subunit